jgi:hypothetical protein
LWPSVSWLHLETIPRWRFELNSVSISPEF